MMAAVWCNVRDKGERRIRKGQRVPREESEKVDVCGWKDLGVKEHAAACQTGNTVEEQHAGTRIL